MPLISLILAAGPHDQGHDTRAIRDCHYTITAYFYTEWPEVAQKDITFALNATPEEPATSTLSHVLCVIESDLKQEGQRR
jgi:hypothetical protein